MGPANTANDCALIVLTGEQIERLDEHQTDAYLDHTRRVFLRADQRHAEAEACEAYIQLDQLLDHRLRIPQQRRPVE